MRRLFMFVFLMVTVAARVEAATTVFTDRTTWLANFYAQRTDDFAADAAANYATPFTSASGIVFSTISGQAGTVQILPQDLVNGTHGVHFREFGAGMLLTLPESVRAVGFDYDTAIESWTVEFGGAKHTLPPQTKGFIGFADECLLHRTITFSSPPGGAQGGIDLDDLSVEAARTFRAGKDDALAQPNDASVRSAALTALVPLAQWKDFDDTDNNRWMGHTFTGLPPNITWAELRVAMKPDGGGSGNDAVALGLGATTFAYSRHIDDLPGANGTWINNPETVFTFDLGSLPGGGSILSKVAADGFLDVRVQDDTTVDWMELRVRTCPPQMWICGLPVLPVGDAQIEIGAHADALITNIGSSGRDGAVISLGEAEGWSGKLGDLPYTLPDGAYQEWTMRGTVDGVPDRTLWVEKHKVVATADGRKEVSVAMDSSAVGATRNSLQIYDRGVLVFSGEFPNGEMYRFVPETTTPPALQRAASWDATCVVIVIHDPWKIKAGARLITNYDMIVTKTINPQGKVTARTSVETTGAGISQTLISDQAVILFGRPNRAVGRATLEAFGGVLTAANLGPAGEDGVDVNFGKAEELNVALGPVDPAGRLPVGAFLRATATGSRDGVPESALGTLTITKTAADYQIAADFSAIGATSQHIEIYDQGRLVADFRGHTGVAGTSSDWPINIGKLGGRTECYSGDFDRGTTFVIDGQAYQGDRIHVLAEGVTGTIDYKSALTLRAGGGIDRLTLTGAAAAFCPSSIDLFPSGIAQAAAGSPYPVTQFWSPSAYGPFSFSMTGSLPAGMTFTPDGRLAGTPAAPGSFPITITARSTSGCTATRSFVLQVVDSPRVVQIGSTVATAGATIELPIDLKALGDENALGMTVAFNPAILTSPQAVLGSGAAGATLTINSSRLAEGRLGLAVALPAGNVFAAGTRRIALLRFVVSPGAPAAGTSVLFADQPIPRGTANASAEPLATTYATGTVTIARGFEADVSPRPSGDGDGTVTAADWAQVGRFVAGLDVAATGSEFQRADSAPRASSGDGAITIADWVQAGRYAAGLDPVAPAGGPTAASASRTVVADSRRSQSRALRIATTSSVAGRTVVTLRLDARGNENAVAASLSFDPRRLRFVSLVSAADGAVLHVNASQSASGRIGFVLALPPGRTISSGSRDVVQAEFELLGGKRGTMSSIAVTGEVADVTGAIVR